MRFASSTRDATKASRFDSPENAHHPISYANRPPLLSYVYQHRDAPSQSLMDAMTVEVAVLFEMKLLATETQLRVSKFDSADNAHHAIRFVNQRRS